jgi:hypothetical protein
MAVSKAQEPTRWVLLPSNGSQEISLLYPAEMVSGKWTPEKADIQALESSLDQITSLKATVGDPKIHIEHPDQYYRQYVGIIFTGRKRILVNSICEVKYNPDWRERLIVVVDGGPCFWHALFDPETRKFSDLEINGRA